MSVTTAVTTPKKATRPVTLSLNVNESLVINEKPRSFPPFPYADLLNKDFEEGDWRGDLKRNGYAVIPALTREKALEYRSKALGWLEAFGLGFDRNDPSTFTQDHMPIHHMGGMYTSEGYGLAHERWIWELKQEPGILAAFERLWGTKKLVTSFDGGAIMMPHPDREAHAELPELHWEHIDLSPSREGFFLAQSFINLNDNGLNDGGLVVIKGSSRLMKDFFDEHGRPPVPPAWFDHYRFNLKELQWFIDRGCESVKVCADPGDLVIWDSATIHQNRPPRGDKDRIVHYICMGPEELLTERDKKERARAWKEQKPTTHVPFQGALCRDHEPNRRPDGSLCPVEDKRIQPVVPNAAILRLAGLLPYEGLGEV